VLPARQWGDGGMILVRMRRNDVVDPREHGEVESKVSFDNPLFRGAFDAEKTLDDRGERLRIIQ
jgi:hypothetical protein